MGECSPLGARMKPLARMKPPQSAKRSLRRRAEDELAARRATVQRDTATDPQRLIHELEVHQIELELQNQELRATRHELEVGLARYTELFDFAPVGYVVVESDGTIRELNISAAQLLGAERRRLVGRRI